MAVIPQTDKKGFISAVKRQISTMKTCGYTSCNYVHTVVCVSPTSDVALQTWDMTFHNLHGRPFRAYIRLKHTWKNGRSDDVQMPVVIWHTQKDFLDFVMRECDK